MRREEAVAAARAVAEDRQWAWVEPVNAVRFRQYWIGPARWRVTSNAEARGRNVIVTIDDSSRRILSAALAPR
jgi:hypothetical protein